LSAGAAAAEHLRPVVGKGLRVTGAAGRGQAVARHADRSGRHGADCEDRAPHCGAHSPLGHSADLEENADTTTIHVTHDQQEALAVADLIAVMKEGRLEQLGAPLQLYHEPATAFVASFVGGPPMSLVAASLVERDRDLALALADGRLSLP
jgi:hypothetical protein